MRNLLLFLQKYNYALLFLLLEACSLTLLFRFNSYQGSVWFTSANTLSGEVHALQAEVLSYFALRQLNRDLTDRNVQLELENGALRKHLEETADSAALTPAMRLLTEQYRTVAASVVHISLNRKDNYLTIDRGEADGVKPEMGVLSGNGLAGIVCQTTPHYALVMPLLHSNSHISCRIRGRGYFGYLRWDGGESQYAILGDVPRHAFFRKGDMVETSGYSDVFPAGIPVGRIVAVYDSSDGLAYELKVKLSTDFGRLRDVRVICRQENPELRLLHSQAGGEEEKEGGR